MSSVIFIAKAVSVLQSRLLGDRNEWASAIMTWSRLQRELASRGTTDITPSTDLGVMRKREEGRGSTEQKEEEEKCHVQTRKSTGEQKEEESENRRLRTGEKNGAQTLQKKKKTEDEGRGTEGTRVVERKWKKETSGETYVEQQTLGKKRKRDDEEEDSRGAAPDSSHEKNVEEDKTSERGRSEEEEQVGMFMGFSGAKSVTDCNGGSLCDNAAPGLDHSVESSSGSTDGFVVQSVENGNKNFFLFVYSGFNG